MSDTTDLISGYLINSEAILKSDYLLSFGIFDDWSFEKNMIFDLSADRYVAY